ELVVLVDRAFACPCLDLLAVLLPFEDDLGKDRHLHRLAWADGLVLPTQIDGHRLDFGFFEADGVVAGEPPKGSASDEGKGQESNRKAILHARMIRARKKSASRNGGLNAQPRTRG